MSTSPRPDPGRPRPATPGRGDPDPRTTTMLVSDVLQGARTIVEKQVEFARQQMAQAGAAAGMALGAGITAAALALFGLGFLGAALGSALTGVVAAWLAWLIVAGVYLLLAVIAVATAAFAGRRSSLAPQRIQESIREDLEWVRQRRRR